MGAETLHETPSTTTLVHEHNHMNEKDTMAVSQPCGHQPSNMPAMTRLLQTPTARTVIQSVVTHLQRILDEDQCTTCAVESGVKTATAGVMEVKRVKKDEKKAVGWWGGNSNKSEGEKSAWEREGWDKKTVKAAGKEMKGLMKGFKAEMKEQKMVEG